MALREVGDSSRERMASPSRSRSNVRPRPTVPETTTAIHRMPAVTAAGGRASPTTNAKLKISTTTTARKVIVARISRLRHSMRRSLAAMRTACRKKDAGRARAADPSGIRSLLIDGAQRRGAEAARAHLVVDHAPAAQHHDVLRHGGGGVQIVGHEDDDAPGVALRRQLGLQPGGARR